MNFIHLICDLLSRLEIGNCAYDIWRVGQGEASATSVSKADLALSGFDQLSGSGKGKRDVNLISLVGIESAHGRFNRSIFLYTHPALFSDEQAREPHSSPNAGTHYSDLQSPPLHLRQHGRYLSCPSSSERMAECNSTALHIDLFFINPKLSYTVQRLARECLINFPDLNFVLLDARLTE